MVVLPTPPADLTVDFFRTTFYHWPQMSQNLTEQRGKTLTDADYTETGGAYITFQKGDHLDKTKVKYFN